MGSVGSGCGRQWLLGKWICLGYVMCGWWMKKGEMVIAVRTAQETRDGEPETFIYRSMAWCRVIKCIKTRNEKGKEETNGKCPETDIEVHSQIMLR